MSCHSFLLDFLFFIILLSRSSGFFPFFLLAWYWLLFLICVYFFFFFFVFLLLFLFTFLSDLIRQVSFLFFIIAVGRSLGLFVHCLEAVWVMEQMKQWQNSGNELLVPEIGFNHEGEKDSDEDSSGESDTSSATTTDYVLPPR